MARAWWILIVCAAAGPAMAETPKPTPPPSRAMPKDYACGSGNADRKAGVCLCAAGMSSARDTRDFAVCVGNVMADPCSDVRQLADEEAKADSAMSAGKFAGALASYELVVRCKRAVVQKAYFAACKARSFQKAQAYFAQLPDDKRQRSSAVCLKEGYDPRITLAQSKDRQCACENSVGVPIEETHCGYLVCGTDRQVYRCGKHVGGTPWTLVQPVRQCPAQGRLGAEKAIELGGDCSKTQACTAPATCVSYRGIAGARGPTFQTCEIKCGAKTACPSGTRCVRIADGPGEVCR